MPIFGYYSDVEWIRWAVAGGILLLFTVLAIVSRLVLKGFLLLFAHRTKTKLDDMVVAAMGLPFIAGLLVIGIWLALIQIPELTPFLSTIHKIGTIMFITVSTVLVVRVTSAMLAWYHLEVAPRTKFDGDDKIAPLLQRVSTVVIYAIGLLIILDQLHVNISPILAGLGIGGLAVALALQSTLTNFLAGTYVMSDAVIHAGDYIMLDSGQEGFVEDIGWRTTKLRHWQGNLIILPNSKLSEAVITNFERPAKALIFKVDCGVNYNSDLHLVEKVALEAAAEALKNAAEGSKDFQPLLRFKEFGDSNINFSVVLQSMDRIGQFVLKSEFIKILHQRFKENGIDIQYPARKIYFADKLGFVKPDKSDKDSPEVSSVGGP